MTTVSTSSPSSNRTSSFRVPHLETDSATTCQKHTVRKRLGVARVPRENRDIETASLPTFVGACTHLLTLKSERVHRRSRRCNRSIQIANNTTTTKQLSKPPLLEKIDTRQRRCIAYYDNGYPRVASDSFISVQDHLLVQQNLKKGSSGPNSRLLHG